ncbi:MULTISPECIES: SdiA-regulated domain-containing protein [unclassified Leeuwenhoekiella]|uniref:SdiA-regulated domain-containing protein n=1 Tax=unclassified Leeuwenhoekiella TaxID=2615029 RepID=UPI0025BA65B5|nr:MULTISPECIES: SdiA-regulated domain-containing protein [unclassified Leeuwenhoekiella]
MKTLKYPIRFLFILLGLFSLFSFCKMKSEEFKKNKPYRVIKTWELPDELDEISGISWLGANQVAAIEDENGLIFIYDLKQSEVVSTLEFADDGDYEGVAVVENTAYVMRSDGLLFEITNYTSDNPEVKTYQTPLDDDNNVESLTYDGAHKRLLFMAKDEGKDSETEKEIYAFDVVAKKLLPFSKLKLDMEDKALKDFEKKKEKRTFRPSDIAVNPKTGAIYILEGADPKLLIMDKSGAVKTVFELDKDDFPQPEGITFTPEGRLFISNEGHGEPATIVEVALKNSF